MSSPQTNSPTRRRPVWRAEVPFLLIALALSACTEPEAGRTIVDDAALADETQEANWLAYGRTSSEKRFSPLAEIDDSNVAGLAPDWYLDLPGERNLSSTPLVVDGVLYFTGSYSRTRAVDARTGAVLWEYDPKSIEHAGDRLRNMWDTSRGLA